MRKSLTYKILLSVLALTAINYALPANTTAGKVNDDYYVDYDGETVSGNFDNVYGNGHSFTITGGKIISKIINVYGAGNDNQDYDKDASGGNVTINGNAKVTGYVYGGHVNKGSANNNTVNISGGTISSVGMTTYVYGGYAKNGSANNNIVNISGNADVTGYVYGGRSVDRSAYHNIVNISGGSVGYVRGGWSDNGEAYDNTVNINGGNVTDDVRGGWSDNGQAYDNTVNISGGIIGEANDIINIYGGYSDGGNAYDNEVVISGSADIKNANLYGRND